MINNINFYINQVEVLIKTADVWLVVFTIFIGLLTSYLVSIRQKVLFEIINKNVSVSFLWLSGFASSIASILLPFFTGGLTFGYLISKKYKINYSKAFGIVFLDFIIALIFTVIFGFIGSLVWGVRKPVVILVFVTLITSLIFFIFKNKSFKILKVLLKSRTNIYKAVLISLLIFVLGNVQGYLFFTAFGLNVNFIHYVFATSLFGLLNLIPGVPAKIGQYELIGTVTYWYLLGLNQVQVATILLSQHAISLIVSISIGLIAIMVLKLKK